MNLAVLLAASGAVLTLGACSSDWSDYEYTPSSGTVIELEHEAAEYEQECGYDYEYDPITGKYKNVYGCDSYYEEECWLVEFETPQGNVIEDCTTEEMFKQLEVGMVYIEDMDALATHTPWLTPSPSPSASVSPSASASAG